MGDEQDHSGPQTPREALALAMIAARERRVTETHNDVLPIYLFGFDDATEAALEAIAALPRCSDATVDVPQGHELCSACGRLFKWGETCTRGGCPCGGDV